MGDWTVDGNLTINNTTTPSEPLFTTDEVLESIGIGAAPQNAKMLELANEWRLDPGGGIHHLSTKDVLADALLQLRSTQFYSGAGESYTGTLPASNYAYGTFVVQKRTSSYIYVLAFPGTYYYSVAYNVYNGSWSGWQRLAVYNHFGIRSLTGSKAAVYGSDVSLIETTLPAGSSYLVLCVVDSSVGSSSTIMSNSLTVVSGTYNYGGVKGTRTTMQAGGGLMNYTFISPTTDCVIRCSSYGYLNSTYNLRAMMHIIRFPQLTAF